MAATLAALLVAPAADAHAPGCNTRRCDRRETRHYQHRIQKLGRQVRASFYGPRDQGGRLACAGIHGIPANLSESTLGVANKTLPCGHRVRVCARRCCVVRVVDRGPYVAGRDYDLTIGLARAIGFRLGAGVASVRVSVL